MLGDVPPGEIVAEVERLALGSMEFHLERRLRSAALLLMVESAAPARSLTGS